MDIATKIFINLIRQYPYLYSKKEKGYKDLAKKENVWKSIAETFGSTGNK